MIGVAAHSFYRMALGGGQRPATFSVHATTDPVARGTGSSSVSSASTRSEAEARGAAVVLAFASAPTAPIFLGPLGWTQIAQAAYLGAALPRVSLRRGRAGRIADAFESDGDAASALAEPRRARRRRT